MRTAGGGPHWIFDAGPPLLRCSSTQEMTEYVGIIFRTNGNAAILDLLRYEMQDGAAPLTALSFFVPLWNNIFNVLKTKQREFSHGLIEIPTPREGLALVHSTCKLAWRPAPGGCASEPGGWLLVAQLLARYGARATAELSHKAGLADSFMYCIDGLIRPTFNIWFFCCGALSILPG
eukprot:6209339-Pleurochrysis_carterae.AAC.1